MRAYKYSTQSERDAKAERRLQAHADEPVDLRDDNREPGSVVIDWCGVKLNWTCVPDKRHVRQWVVYDENGVFVMRAGVDEIVKKSAAKVPRRMIGSRQFA